ncbi:MAG: SMI1/KNR4 family protein [Tepidisphaera sp.]|jgi:hypothetical protein
MPDDSPATQPTPKSSGILTIEHLCAELQGRFPRDRIYAPPTEIQTQAAEQALGVKLPTDYLRFLHLTHDLSLPFQVLRIAPNGHWHPVAHDIVDATLSRRKDGLSSRFVILRKCGGDGGYDAFDTKDAPPGKYPIVHFTYQRGGVKGGRTAEHFVQWLSLQMKTSGQPY